MCGIVGYLGKDRAEEIILNGLKKLEYRGYDSWGYLVYDGKELFLEKKVGKISEVSEKGKDGFVGIGHTRWATHGGVTEYNAHPHFDCQRKIFVVHNGIIENYDVLKNLLIKEGHKFNSETDTEVIAHLIEKFLKEGSNFETAIFKTVNSIRGSFALVIFNLDEPKKLVAIRFASPLILGKNKEDIVVASDPLPIKLVTSEFVPLGDGEIAFIEENKFSIKDFKNNHVEIKTQKIDWDLEEIELGNFPDFMLKEIYEVPKAVKNTLRGRIIPEKGEIKLGGLELIEDKLRKIKKVILTACGTAYYAGLIGKLYLEEFTNLEVDSEIASELRYRNYKFNEETLLVAISQSGETADTLEAVKTAKEKGALTLGIINVPGSTISRAVNAGIYTYAGPERAVASTKAYFSQIIALLLLSLFLGLRRDLTHQRVKEILRELILIPEKMEKIFDLEEGIKNLAYEIKDSKSMFYLGRKFSYPVALEGALKMKEISYIHAEAYQGGEMKHGPLALVEENFPVIFIAPKDSLYQKSLSNIEEVKARGGKVILVTDDSEVRIENKNIFVPKTREELTTLLTTLPLHLLAYYTAKFLGRNIDRPRNLAKSVTVE
jgi:glucosamine--fructose-6-phosphate aminotransferase (isomerizing)